MIELLVVIGIIAVLWSGFAPVFASAAQGGRAADACAAQPARACCCKMDAHSAGTCCCGHSAPGSKVGKLPCHGAADLGLAPTVQLDAQLPPARGSRLILPIAARERRRVACEPAPFLAQDPFTPPPRDL